MIFEGEPIALIFRTRQGVEALESIVRLTEAVGKISNLQAYSFTPETKKFVGELLGLKVRTGGYRYPTPAPGKRFMDIRKMIEDDLNSPQVNTLRATERPIV